MKRRPKQRLSTEDGSVATGAEAILQVKVWLIGISPMVWRRVLVPAELRVHRAAAPARWLRIVNDGTQLPHHLCAAGK